MLYLWKNAVIELKIALINWSTSIDIVGLDCWLINRRRDLYDKSKMAREPGKKLYKTLQGNPCFSRFKTSRCLESLRTNFFWKQLIIAEILSTIRVISVEFLVKISLVKCVGNWSLGQFETFVVQNMYFWPALASWVLLWPTAILNQTFTKPWSKMFEYKSIIRLICVVCDFHLQSCIL